jgi:regulator of cell morphogenesis and NO signaling
MKYQTILGPCDETTVDKLIARFPETKNVFKKYGVDLTVCGGYTIKQVAESHKLAHAELCQSLFDNCIQFHPLEDYDADTLLAILQEHYQSPHLQELPELHRLARKIEVVHRQDPMLPKGITLAVKHLESLLVHHIESERKYVLKEMEHDQPPKPHTPIAQMNYEHDEIKQELKNIRAITNQYNTPKKACKSWKRLYSSLKNIDFSLSEQICIERDILFPRYQF